MVVAATLSKSTIWSVLFHSPAACIYTMMALFTSHVATQLCQQLQDKIYLALSKQFMVKYLKKMYVWNVSIISCLIEIETITQLIFKLFSMKATKDWITEKVYYQECCYKAWKRDWWHRLVCLLVTNNSKSCWWVYFCQLYLFFIRTCNLCRRN